MKNIITIFKKEWDRVIKDRRLVITVMIMPGLMIFLIYTFLGSAMTNLTTEDFYDVAIINQKIEFKDFYSPTIDAETYQYNINIISSNPDQIDFYKAKIDDGSWDLLVILDEDLLDYDGGDVKPINQIYYNVNEIASTTMFNEFYQFLTGFEEQLSTEYYGDNTYFNITIDSIEMDETNFMGRIIASLIPMLIVMFLFSGAMSIGPESIAGEKERGTIATLLVTPVKRREIAIGKISALSLLTLISASSSFLGIILSLPKLMQFDEGMSANIYSVADYLMILVVLFSTVFIIVGLISIISAYAKNLKEASTLIMPMYILTIIISITSMFGDGANSNLFMYALPIYNSVQTLTAILTFDEMTFTYLVITFVFNITYLMVFVLILNKMFSSEKIMFSK